MVGHCQVHCITTPQSVFRGDIYGEFSKRLIERNHKQIEQIPNAVSESLGYLFILIDPCHRCCQFWQEQCWFNQWKPLCLQPFQQIVTLLVANLVTVECTYKNAGINCVQFGHQSYRRISERASIRLFSG